MCIRRHLRHLTPLSGLWLLALLVGSVQAEDWPCWRGPRHDGLSPEKGLQTKFELADRLVWEREIGSAFSAFICVGGRAYTCGTVDKNQVLFCLDADTGRVIWRQTIEPEYRERQGGDGTRATPTFDAGFIYVLGARGRLVCYNAERGTEVWSRQFAAMPQWGYSGSVLIEGPLAILTAGGEDGPLLAVEKKTGKTAWQCGSDPVGYATPYPFTLEGQRYVVGFLGKFVVIAEARTGREVFRMPWETSYDVNAAAPIFHDGHLFLSSGYGHGAALLKLTVTGDKLQAQTVWKSKVIQAKFQSPVLYEGHLYTSGDTGLNCVEFATGKETWSDRSIVSGTVLIADGHLLVLTERGELQIAPVSPLRYEPVNKVRLLRGRCWTVPTLHRGKLYARNLERAVCVNLSR